MKYSIAHVGFSVENLDRSIAFYKQAFDMDEVFRLYPRSDLNLSLSFLKTPDNGMMINLIHYNGRERPEYDEVRSDFHIAIVVDDLEASYERHKQMGIITVESMDKQIYYVNDPDGYEIAVTLDKCHPEHIFYIN